MIAWTDLSEVEQICQEYSDLSKDMYGFRMRLNRDISVEAAREALADLYKESEHVFARQEEEEKARIAHFESCVSVAIVAGAMDRATAIRWMMDAELEDMFKGDVEHFEYRMGIPFGYIKKTS